MLHLKKGFSTKDLEGYTVLLPSFSIVNASQLALDVLIASKKMQRIGQIIDNSLVPIYGHSAFQHDANERAAACEVYADKKSKLLVIQFRTVMVIEYGGPFHKNLGALLKEINVERIIVMSTAVQYGQEDFQLQYEATDSFKKAYQKDLDEVKWAEYAKTEIMGGGNDKLLFKVFEMNELPVMIFYCLVGSPTEAIEEKVLSCEVKELVEKFLKAKQDFNLSFPVGWDSSIGHETGEMMY